MDCQIQAMFSAENFEINWPSIKKGKLESNSISLNLNLKNICFLSKSASNESTWGELHFNSIKKWPCPVRLNTWAQKSFFLGIIFS